MEDAAARIASLGRTPRLVDAVIERIRDSIVTGALPAGTHLLQMELAEQLGVSRTPLREAFRVLESEGVIRVSHNERSVEVVSLGPDDVRDMFEVREVVDGLAARLAAKHGLTSAEEQKGKDLLEELDRTSERYVPEQRNRLHTQFHELIALASRNSKVETFIPLIRSSSAALHMPAIRNVMAENVESVGEDATFKEALLEAQRQHKEILKAILERNQKKAENAARVHIQRTLQLAPQLHQLTEGAGQDEEH